MKGAALGAAATALALLLLLGCVGGRGREHGGGPSHFQEVAGADPEGSSLWLTGSEVGGGGAGRGAAAASSARSGGAHTATRLPSPSASPPSFRPPVLISYAYFEKDPIQAANLAFFLEVGLAGSEGGAPGVAGGQPRPSSPSSSPSTRRADTILTVSGPTCTPCAPLAMSGLAPLPMPPGLDPTTNSLAGAWGRPGLTLLHRAGNVGMDFGAHNATLAWAAAVTAAGGGGGGAGDRQRVQGASSSFSVARAAAKRYGYPFFIFLNSSARGPFVPAYLPAGWHWTRAFMDGLDREGCGGAGGDGGGGGNEGGPTACLPPSEAPPAATAASLVAASLACLPPEDAGGPGPRAESWAFALSSGGLGVAEAAGVFAVRTCKLCAESAAGIVVGGEYGLSAALLAAGRRLATLQARYARGVDWSDTAHWGCNACAHASRHGTYGPGLALHPFETLFVKASWGVGAPFLEAYTAWAAGHARGDDPGTGAVLEGGWGKGGGGEGSRPPRWAGPAACDAALRLYAISSAATAPEATAGVAACFLPPGLKNGSSSRA